MTEMSSITTAYLNEINMFFYRDVQKEENFTKYKKHKQALVVFVEFIKEDEQENMLLIKMFNLYYGKKVNVDIQKIFGLTLTLAGGGYLNAIYTSKTNADNL